MVQKNVKNNDITLESGDLSIGAVELKDATTATRIALNAANTARTTSTVVIPSQNIDATGKIQPAGEALGNEVIVKPSDGTTAITIETDGTKKAMNVNVTDGTNDMPTMDAVARRGLVGLTDGTNDAVIDPANTGRTTGTVVQTTQNIGANGSPTPSGATAADPIHVSTGGAVASTIGDGRKEVSTAGSRETLATSTTVKEVTVTAELNNTDVVVVGGSTCVAALATRRGIPLYPGDSFTVATDNLVEVYIDSMVSTEGVTFTYLA